MVSAIVNCQNTILTIYSTSSFHGQLALDPNISKHIECHLSSYLSENQTCPLCFVKPSFANSYDCLEQQLPMLHCFAYIYIIAFVTWSIALYSSTPEPVLRRHQTSARSEDPYWFGLRWVFGRITRIFAGETPYFSESFPFASFKKNSVICIALAMRL